MNSTTMFACISCNKEIRKYKCSQCKMPYCSLDCYKVHKDSPQCAEAVKESHAKLQTTHENDNEPTLYEPFSTEDTVSREKLERLRESKPLHELLYNPHLRNLLQEIDTSRSAWRAMQAAMQEPLFVEFANVCLNVIEPVSEEERKELNLL